jgi:hypothetical protein
MTARLITDEYDVLLAESKLQSRTSPRRSARIEKPRGSSWAIEDSPAVETEMSTPQDET